MDPDPCAPPLSQEPDADVNSFFKKLYAGADPDAQRAMLKSFQESGGVSQSQQLASSLLCLVA